MKNLLSVYMILLVFCLTAPAFAQEKTTADSVIVKAELIKKYESEIEKLKKNFDVLYMQIATNDPIVTQRMNQLIDGNAMAVSLITSMQLYSKLIKDLKGELWSKQN